MTIDLGPQLWRGDTTRDKADDPDEFDRNHPLQDQAETGSERDAQREETA